MKMIDAVRMLLNTNFGDRAIAASLRMSKTTIRRYRKLIKKNNYKWEVLRELAPSELHRTFNRQHTPSEAKRLPDFAQVQKEMRKQAVTLQLLWEEYREIDPNDALSYSRFTALYRGYLKRLPRSMRQEHPPGEAVFVDYSGKKKPTYIDAGTGTRTEVELFVGVLGASNYTFATCSRTQTVADWIASNTAMLEYFGGVPMSIVPDNLKSAVIKAGPSPTIQRTFLDFARHYNIAIMPARPGHPKDKGKVEVGVQIAQRWIVARLRHRIFFSFEEINEAVAGLVESMNQKRQRRLPGTRYEIFQSLDKPALRPLHPSRFVYAEWAGKQLVPPDYHLPVEGHFYSVPHGLVGERVEGRSTLEHVEFFHDGKKVASHRRGIAVGGHTTVREHQPDAHRAQADRNPAAMRAWAETIGPNTLAVVARLFDRGKPMLGMPASESVKKMVDQYGGEAVERAAARAIALKTMAPSNVLGLLRNQRARNAKTAPTPPPHSNLRGAQHYSEDRPC